MPEAELVFTGDLIFAGSIGRTDFTGGDYNTLIQSVRQKIFTLGDNFRILSGHGPITTVGNEKQYNPFFT
jgi:glyoxylase-like metal-dependent hydrolase (beta-lactamase superfamily II)